MVQQKVAESAETTVSKMVADLVYMTAGQQALWKVAQLADQKVENLDKNSVYNSVGCWEKLTVMKKAEQQDEMWVAGRVAMTVLTTVELMDSRKAVSLVANQVDDWDNCSVPHQVAEMVDSRVAYWAYLKVVASVRYWALMLVELQARQWVPMKAAMMVAVLAYLSECLEVDKKAEYQESEKAAKKAAMMDLRSVVKRETLKAEMWDVETVASLVVQKALLSEMLTVGWMAGWLVDWYEARNFKALNDGLKMIYKSCVYLFVNLQLSMWISLFVDHMLISNNRVVHCVEPSTYYYTILYVRMR